MKRASITVFMCLALIPLWFATGCDSEEEKTYEVTVYWQIDNKSACKVFLNDADDAPINFAAVEVKIYKGKGKQVLVYEKNNLECTTYEHTLEGDDALSEGTYQVEVLAYADYEDLYLPYYQAEGEIRVPSDDRRDIFNMTQGTGEVHVEWGFERGTCGSNEVNDIDIVLESTSGPFNTIEQTGLDCDHEGGFTFTGVAWDSYILKLTAYNTKKDVVGTAESEEMTVRPGLSIDKYLEFQ